MVLRKTASREYPKTHLPSHVQRDLPKCPISKMSLFHYTVCKFTSQPSYKGVSRGGPGRWISRAFWYKKGKETIADQQKPTFQENNIFPTFCNDFLKTLGKERRSSTFLSEVGWSHQVSMLLPSTKYNVFKEVKLHKFLFVLKQRVKTRV